MTNIITLSYDDAPNEVIDKVNAALKHRGFRFVIDRRPDDADGEITYKLEFVTK